MNQSSKQQATEQIAEDLLALLQSEKAASRELVQQNPFSQILTESTQSTYLSNIEQQILRSINPIEINATEELTVIGQRGLWLNRDEVNSWRGDISINEYRIHEDNNPQIITKRIDGQIEYVQELAVRYLRPPTPPAAGEIIITQEADVQLGPAPPLIIRQQPARSATPEPLVVREAPPAPPSPVGPKRITISGKRNPPPPRKVVIERLAPLPSKPQNVIIERWLPYANTKRRVIFNKAPEVSAEVARPRNVIVQWEAPTVNIQKEIKYLGVIRANPAEYVQRYGASLKAHHALPQFVLDIATPSEIGTLAANYNYSSTYELEGALEGFRYVNLDTEGMSEYREQLMAQGIRDLGALKVSASMTASAAPSNLSDAAAQIFNMIDVDRSGTIEVEEAEKIVLRMNSQLNRAYGENEVRNFFLEFVSSNSTRITRDQFLSVFDRLV